MAERDPSGTANDVRQSYRAAVLDEDDARWIDAGLASSPSARTVAEIMAE